MAKVGRPKLTLQDIKEQHGLEIDASDPQRRSRYRRHLDNLSARGAKLEDPSLSDVAAGTAVKAAMFYVELTGGKAVTPISSTVTVTHKSAEESASRILELLGQRKKEPEQALRSMKAETIN